MKEDIKISIISKPFTFSAGAVIIASQHNSDFDTIFSDYNGNLDNSNLSSAAGIIYSKLSLTNGIVNADINSSAAIVATKLATIATAGKVSGAALTLLPNIPSGAGVIPTANLPSLLRIQIFTSSGTFTGPTGVTKVYISACSAGGGGGKTSGASGGGGGGGGWVINYPYTVVALSNYTVTINPGGAGKTGGDGTGAVGGTTVFDTLVIPGAAAGTATTGGGGGGQGLNASGGTPGGPSQYGGTGENASGTIGGSGGGTPFGVGAQGVNGGAGVAASAAANSGGGGAGASGTRDAGNGGTGVVIVMW